MTHNNNGPDPSQNYGETVVFTFGRKVFVFFGKMSGFPKKTSEIRLKTYIIWKKDTFLFGQLFTGVARTWLEPRRELSFWALGETVYFVPWDRFFRVTVVFAKKIRPTRQKVFPCPTLGTPSARNSPSALTPNC